MRSNAVNLCLRDGPHADLVEGSCEKGGEGRDKNDVTASAGQPDPHTHHVLLGDEAFDETVAKRFLVGESKGGVLGVSIEGHDAIKVFPKFDQSLAICLACGYL